MCEKESSEGEHQEEPEVSSYHERHPVAPLREQLPKPRHCHCFPSLGEFCWCPSQENI